MINEIEKEISNKRKSFIIHNAKKFKSIIKLAGFNLIGYTELVFFDDVFIFETQKEADDAYNFFEIKNKELFGFWYGKEKFLEVKEHIDKNYINLFVYWIEK